MLILCEIAYVIVAGLSSWVLSQLLGPLSPVVQYFVAGSIGYASAMLMRLYVERGN